MTPQPFISGAVIGTTFLLMLAFEAWRPLRQTREPKIRRMVRNFTTAGISLAAMTLLQAPVLVPVSEWTMARGIGLLHLVALPRWAEMVSALILLDYTLWWWHRASHRVPFLWRFHLPHHADRDLDSSTALRFHFGELALSVGYRAVQIIVLGVDPFMVWVWQTILFASILFHHANVRLPLAMERMLVWLVVTPRMHGIHHSDRRSEADSNWSSLLSVWDRLHRTLLLNVPQREVIIGVPAYQHPEDVTIGKVLALPFVRQRENWQREDGQPAGRELDRRVTSLAV